MHANRPYDPRYNAKVYIPKLTEEQRRARATPIDNLRQPRFQLPNAEATVAESVPQPAPSVAPEVSASPQTEHQHSSNSAVAAFSKAKAALVFDNRTAEPKPFAPSPILQCQHRIPVWNVTVSATNHSGGAT